MLFVFSTYMHLVYYSTMQLIFGKYLGVSSGVALDSARQNLASSFVNSFVNAAFGADKLLTEDGNKWIYKNKEHGMNIYL